MGTTGPKDPLPVHHRNMVSQRDQNFITDVVGVNTLLKISRKARENLKTSETVEIWHQSEAQNFLCPLIVFFKKYDYQNESQNFWDEILASTSEVFG